MLHRSETRTSQKYLVRPSIYLGSQVWRGRSASLARPCERGSGPRLVHVVAASERWSSRRSVSTWGNRLCSLLAWSSDSMVQGDRELARRRTWQRSSRVGSLADEESKCHGYAATGRVRAGLLSHVEYASFTYLPCAVRSAVLRPVGSRLHVFLSVSRHVYASVLSRSEGLGGRLTGKMVRASSGGPRKEW